MNDHSVSDACLKFAPLTTAERPEVQAISLLVDGEKLPNLQRLYIGRSVDGTDDVNIEAAVAPSRSVLRLSNLQHERRAVEVEYTCRKTRWRGRGSVIGVGECISWPAGIAQIIVRLAVAFADWRKEEL